MASSKAELYMSMSLGGYIAGPKPAWVSLTRVVVRRALDALTGCVLVAFGARLAFEQR